ncbi:MAG: DUF4954 family protein [Candidatus Omnitrophica bacterium]|nr:DUF4954 family protein [Candidatus Omnitrophota bacterium]
MTTKDVLSELKGLISKSEVIKSIQEAHKTAKRRNAQCSPPTKDQIEQLKAQGNNADDWKKVKVAKGMDLSRIRRCYFQGDVTVGKLSGDVEVSDGVKLPAGLYNSIIVDSNIGDSVLIQDVMTLSNYIVLDGAVLFNCGVVSAKDGLVFGNGSELPIAIETGGREVKSYAEITVDAAAKVAASRADKEFLKDYSEAVDKYIGKIKSDKGIIAQGAVVSNSGKVLDAYVGPHAVIDNARSVVNSMVLSNKEEETEISDGSYVKNSLIQWGSEVTSMAIVANSVLSEHSHVERHGKVTDSIIGANTGVAEGEVTACLVGPFVGFHHQSLLIAAFWPEGKGNVGYGANVGSNHTSKAPDQEIWPGEGTFFGLGVNIKFPSDFTKAPYSIIATAVNALPQKVTLPFSLINSPAARFEWISPAYNEISPGWVLSDNIFTIRRNEGKYRKRNKAKRAKIEFEVFRPEIVEMMLDARKRLQDVKQQKAVYTDKDIRGIGKNYMLEESRKAGVEAYTFYIRYYALLGLKRRLEGDNVGAGSKPALKQGRAGHGPAPTLAKKTSDPRWEHERLILNQELPNNSVEDNLKLLVTMQEKIARDVQSSKEKDDVRGARVIDDYPQAHAPASEDGFVKQTHQETAQLKKEVEALLKTISAGEEPARSKK